MNHFDQAAATWDGNSVHWERSKAIADEITTLLPLSKEWRVLEYGAGTGILSFMLKDAVKEICMMDSSAEMVKVMQQKVSESDLSPLYPLQSDLEKESYAGARFDLIATQMVLHHVAVIPRLIEHFYEMLNDGGYIAIADLYTEDGSFHGKGFTGHNGFNPEDLADTLESGGFKAPEYRECFRMHKPTEDGTMKEFPVFILIARK
jgi:tRNA (cmo5U34)-methyltransferase